MDFPKDKYVKVPACLNSRYRYNSERVTVCGHKLAWHNNSIFIGFCWCSVGRRLAGAGPGGSIDIEYEAAAAASCPEPGSSQQSVPGGSVTRSTESRVTSDLSLTSPQQCPAQCPQVHTLHLLCDPCPADQWHQTPRPRLQTENLYLLQIQPTWNR